MNWDISKAAPRQGYTRGGSQSVLEDSWISWFCLYFKDLRRWSFFHCALTFLTAEQESRVCSIRCLWVYHRLLLSKHGGSTCRAHKTKQHLVWHMHFYTPQVQVTWVYLQSFLKIFCYILTEKPQKAFKRNSPILQVEFILWIYFLTFSTKLGSNSHVRFWII